MRGNIMEIPEKEYAQLLRFKNIVKHALADKIPDVYFICGENGNKNDLGLPEFIQICPAYGIDANLTVLYKRVDK